MNRQHTLTRIFTAALGALAFTATVAASGAPAGSKTETDAKAEKKAKAAKEQQAVRPAVRHLLERSPASKPLPPDKRREVAKDTTR